MSEPNSQMASIKGLKVYMILYNYSGHDYEVVKIFQSLTDAYNFICKNEINPGIIENFKMIEITNQRDFNSIPNTDEIDLYICCFKHVIYSDFCVYDTDNISNLIIV